jgi:SAM-dependent methyltransferase
MTDAGAATQARHWDTAYEQRGAQGVSWYQAVPVVSLELFDALGIPTSASVIDIGGGTSLLAASLVGRGFTDVTVLDISKSALEVGGAQEETVDVTMLQADVLTWLPSRRYDCWHDRGTFHFFVAEDEREAYRRTLQSAIAPAGFVILATFASDGPPTCSGLPVIRYSTDDLAEVLGDTFNVLETRREEHRTPRGALQPFTWIAGRFRPELGAVA